MTDLLIQSTVLPHLLLLLCQGDQRAQGAPFLTLLPRKPWRLLDVGPMGAVALKLLTGFTEALQAVAVQKNRSQW